MFICKGRKGDGRDLLLGGFLFARLSLPSLRGCGHSRIANFQDYREKVKRTA
jgi:hypothetical protein